MSVCNSCHAFKVFGKKCWYYWEDKKSCSQFKSFNDEEPCFCAEE